MLNITDVIRQLFTNLLMGGLVVDGPYGRISTIDLVRFYNHKKESTEDNDHHKNCTKREIKL